ncbi:hypothetical protein SLE2022_067800 [Rubroshorea leprosula]
MILITYHSRDKEARDEAPEAEKERHNNGSNLMAWGESHEHHSIECEVHEACWSCGVKAAAVAANGKK